MFRWTGLSLHFLKSPKIRVTYPNCCDHHTMDSCSLLQAWQFCFLEIRKMAENHKQETAHKGMILGVPDILRSSSVDTNCSRDRTLHPAAAPLLQNHCQVSVLALLLFMGNETTHQEVPHSQVRQPISPLPLFTRAGRIWGALVLQQELFEHFRGVLTSCDQGQETLVPSEYLGSLGMLHAAQQGAGSIWDTSSFQTRNKLTWAGSRWGAH